MTHLSDQLRATLTARAEHATFDDPRVQAIFDAYEPTVRERLKLLRALVFHTADDLDGVGRIEETLRWGEPSYLTSASKSGTAIRLHSKQPGQVAMYVHCQTDLVATYRERHGDTLTYEGTRAVVVAADEPLPIVALRDCVALALTYKLRKKRR